VSRTTWGGTRAAAGSILCSRRRQVCSRREIQASHDNTLCGTRSCPAWQPTDWMDLVVHYVSWTGEPEPATAQHSFAGCLLVH